MRLREQILRQKAAGAFEKSRETGWGERASRRLPFPEFKTRDSPAFSQEQVLSLIRQCH